MKARINLEHVSPHKMGSNTAVEVLRALGVAVPERPRKCVKLDDAIKSQAEWIEEASALHRLSGIVDAAVNRVLQDIDPNGTVGESILDWYDAEVYWLRAIVNGYESHVVNTSAVFTAREAEAIADAVFAYSNASDEYTAFGWVVKGHKEIVGLRNKRGKIVAEFIFVKEAECWASDLVDASKDGERIDVKSFLDYQLSRPVVVASQIGGFKVRR